MPLLGERRIRTLLEGAIAACSGATQMEVVLTTEDSALTRFANNAIHQNVAERNSSIRVRAVFGKRIGVASTNSLEAAAVKAAAEDACAIARYSAENPDFVSLPGPSTLLSAPGAFSEKTAAATPGRRGDAVTNVI